jgi:hypothetical protein
MPATVAMAEKVIERVPNLAPLALCLAQLRRICRAISCAQRGSNRLLRKEAPEAASSSDRNRSTRYDPPASRRGWPSSAAGLFRVVAEGLDAARVLCQKRSPGKRAEPLCLREWAR